MPERIAPIAVVLLVIVLAIAAVTDWREGRIPNWLTVPAMVGGLVFWSLAGLIDRGTPGAADAAVASGLALAAGFVPMFVVAYAGGFGGGDVKLMGAVGAISADWRCVLATLVYALLVGGVMSIFIMVRRGVVRQTLKRIGSAAIGMMARSAVPVPDDGPRVPFGVAISVGGFVAAAEHMLGLMLPWSIWGP
ncbi:MAG: hypothetical protein CMJ18_28035 [Phycisphaeraceae bacterium]|nr:hypothetical protein [Phycisphaeraceae bacterium]